ncbi:MAG: Gliding motility-associated ABC transporter permease protein GldF [Rhodanobacteraceae bacterium]|jgi:ABC-2 type transport system permease protein|nr:MAG: Gliding motility-associated ABC transporter permease protein GldF [Rhodanobacteraceae bacterium]
MSGVTASAATDRRGSPFAGVFLRELHGYLITPVAWLFSVIFLLSAGAFTFYLGAFFERGQADLDPFFRFHPWLYLVLVPALAMRLWAEERRSGTLELLMTLPIHAWQAVLAKFLAAWLYIGCALALTFPMWLTVNYLGQPDNGVILAGYLGSFLMAGALLAISECLSVLTRSQVIAFILALAVCFLFLLAGDPLVQQPLLALGSNRAADALSDLSLLAHFQAIASGVLDLGDIAYFVLTIVFWLAANALVLAARRGG